MGAPCSSLINFYSNHFLMVFAPLLENYVGIHIPQPNWDISQPNFPTGMFPNAIGNYRRAHCLPGTATKIILQLPKPVSKAPEKLRAVRCGHLHLTSNVGDIARQMRMIMTGPGRLWSVPIEWQGLVPFLSGPRDRDEEPNSQIVQTKAQREVHVHLGRHHLAGTKETKHCSLATHYSPSGSRHLGNQGDNTLLPQTQLLTLRIKHVKKSLDADKLVKLLGRHYSCNINKSSMKGQ